MKKLICLALILCLLLSLLAGCSSDTAESEGPSSDKIESESPSKESAPDVSTEPVPDEEIQKAIDLGFVPENLRTDYDSQITYAEFCSILDNFISVVRPESLDNWQKESSLFRNSPIPITRAEGMPVFLFAAECAGVDTIGYTCNVQTRLLPLRCRKPRIFPSWTG